MVAQGVAQPRHFSGAVDQIPKFPLVLHYIERITSQEHSFYERCIRHVCTLSSGDIANHFKFPLFLRFGSSFICLKQLKLESSNLVHWQAIASISLGMINHPHMGVVRSRDPLLNFGASHVCRTNEAIHFKFGVEIDHGEYQHMHLTHDRLLPRAMCSRSRDCLNLGN